MASNGKEFEGIAYLIGLGGFFFFTGFRKLRLRRKAIGLATSRARSMAMGTVELSGIADKYVEATDPIFKMPCAYYHIKVEERRGSGKNRHWVTVLKDQSPQPFFCKDTTGRVLILPKEAGLHFRDPIVLSGGAGFLNRPLFTTKATPSSGSASRDYLARWNSNHRITAHIIREGDPVYVIGCALPTRECLNASSGPVAPALPGDIAMAANLKKDAARMKEMDANKDGHVDAQEWEEGMAKYKRFLEMKHAHETELAKEEREKKMAAADPLEFSGIVTSTAEVEMILASSEEDLVSRLGVGAFLGVFGGGAALILGLILLLLKFN